MKSVKHNQVGSTLIEMMVASLIGIIVIAIIGSVFITGQNTATKRSHELLLLQNIFGTFQSIKGEIQRAGYDGSQGQSLKLSGASHTIYTEISGSTSTLGLVYLISAPGSSSVYRNITYTTSPNNIKYCEGEGNQILSIAEMRAASSALGVPIECEGMFFKKQIKVNKFMINPKNLIASSTNSQVIDVEIEATHVNSGLTKSVSTSIKQRNWQ